MLFYHSLHSTGGRFRGKRCYFVGKLKAIVWSVSKRKSPSQHLLMLQHFARCSTYRHSTVLLSDCPHWGIFFLFCVIFSSFLVSTVGELGRSCLSGVRRCVTVTIITRYSLINSLMKDLKLQASIDKDSE
jgi:hypothetical protein